MNKKSYFSTSVLYVTLLITILAFEHVQVGKLEIIEIMFFLYKKHWSQSYYLLLAKANLEKHKSRFYENFFLKFEKQMGVYKMYFNK